MTRLRTDAKKKCRSQSIRACRAVAGYSRALPSPSLSRGLGIVTEPALGNLRFQTQK
jgi:hypothetical protein